MSDKKGTEDPPADPMWEDKEHNALVLLIEIQPDLCEIVDDRRQRHKFLEWTKRITHAFIEFLKWAAMIGAGIGILRAGLQGWLK